MYQYTNKYETKPLQTFLMVLAIVVGLVVSNSIFSAIEQKTGMGFFSLFPYGIGAGILYVLYKRVIEEFCYTLTERQLIIERSNGRRAKPFVTVELAQIRALDRNVEGVKPDFRCALPGALLCRLVFEDEKGKKRVLVFAPDAKLKQLLEDKITDFVMKSQKEVQDGKED